MKKQERTIYSLYLERNLDYNVYGYGGIPFILFPIELHDQNDYEKNGIIDALSPFIEEGKIIVYIPNTIDMEAFCSKSDNYTERVDKENQYIKFVADELLHVIYDDHKGFVLPFVGGCSMGAVHASIAFFRRPDLFGGLLSLSGLFDTTAIFNGWMDKKLSFCSPYHFLKSLPESNPFFRLYNKRKIILCIGQGKWEHETKWSYDEFRNLLAQKRISAWFDYWGEDVDHDYPWWAKQLQYFIPFMID